MALTIVAYITGWCPDCTRSRRILQRSGLPYIEIDIEKTPSAEAAMREINGGSGKVPTVLIESDASRSVLVEPGDRELSDALQSAARAGV